MMPGRDGNRLASLSAEGRSSATTVLVSSVFRWFHEPERDVERDKRKLLGFTDNRRMRRSRPAISTISSSYLSSAPPRSALLKRPAIKVLTLQSGSALQEGAGLFSCRSGTSARLDAQSKFGGLSNRGCGEGAA